jgi:hypothetical protein
MATQNQPHGPGQGRHVVAEAILHRALSSLTGVEAAVVPTFRQPSECESEAMAAINEARAKLRAACYLLHPGPNPTSPQD